MRLPGSDYFLEPLKKTIFFCIRKLFNQRFTNQAFNATVMADELGHLKGNRLQLTQLFQNLLSNSLKYRKPDVPLVVSISCRMLNESDPEFKTLPRHPENYLLIQVKDNGIGFEQEHAEKIFHVFQRLHGQSQYQGTGVGLAIVEKVVRNHKGAIYAESEPGKGTTINVLLPAT